MPDNSGSPAGAVPFREDNEMKLSRWLCGLGVAACLAAAPAWADNGGGSVNVKVTEFDLPNGLHVILCEDHTVPMLATDIWYKVGSANETKGRTGFAHLFEHLMFCGSGHVDKGQFDKLLQNVGGRNNASTSEDRTNYYIIMPSNALSLALYLESDRMGYFLDNLRPGIVDEQRDVVKNEMRERSLNAPYMKAFLEIPALMYPEGHPYSWPIIGSMEDLSAAKYEDVVNFYKNNYVPGNASLAIVGDFDTAETKKLVEHWFSDVAQGRVPPALSAGTPIELDGVVKKTITDKVDLPARMILWHSPAEFQEGDAACEVLSHILGGSVYSRLTKRLEYDSQIADSLDVWQWSRGLGSQFMIVYRVRAGHTADEIQAVIDEEIARISQEPPAQEEIDLAVNCMKRRYYDRMQRNVAVADSLNHYYCAVGQADYFDQDIARYSSVTPQEISACAKRYLRPDRRVELSIVPEPKQNDRSNAEKRTVEEAK